MMIDFEDEGGARLSATYLPFVCSEQGWAQVSTHARLELVAGKHGCRAGCALTRPSLAASRLAPCAGLPLPLPLLTPTLPRCRGPSAVLAAMPQEECIDSLVRKAGYRGSIDARLRSRIRLTRYQVCAVWRRLMRAPRPRPLASRWPMMLARKRQAGATTAALARQPGSRAGEASPPASRLCARGASARARL